MPATGLSREAEIVVRHLESHIVSLTKRINIASDVESLQKQRAALKAEVKGLKAEVKGVTQERDLLRQHLECDKNRLGKIRREFASFLNDMEEDKQQFQAASSDIQAREAKVKIQEEFLNGLIANGRVKLD